MVRQEVVHLAAKAGLRVNGEGELWGNVDSLHRIVRKAIEDEREACAKVCDARYTGDNNREDMEAKRCADAIRARGKE